MYWSPRTGRVVTSARKGEGADGATHLAEHHLEHGVDARHNGPEFMAQVMVQVARHSIDTGAVHGNVLTSLPQIQ
jgi:hypothetical protein